MSQCRPCYSPLTPLLDRPTAGPVGSLIPFLLENPAFPVPSNSPLGEPMSLPASAPERSRTQVGERGGQQIHKPVLCTPSPGAREGQTHAASHVTHNHTGLSKMCFLLFTHNAGFDGFL